MKISRYFLPLTILLLTASDFSNLKALAGRYGFICKPEVIVSYYDKGVFVEKVEYEYMSLTKYPRRSKMPSDLIEHLEYKLKKLEEEIEKKCERQYGFDNIENIIYQKLIFEVDYSLSLNLCSITNWDIKGQIVCSEKDGKKRRGDLDVSEIRIALEDSVSTIEREKQILTAEKKVVISKEDEIRWRGLFNPCQSTEKQEKKVVISKEDEIRWRGLLNPCQSTEKQEKK